jgi:hypothetical protein
MAQKSSSLSSLLATVVVCGLSFTLLSLALFVNFPESRPHLHRMFNKLPIEEYEPILNKLKLPDEAVVQIRTQWTQLQTLWLTTFKGIKCEEHKFTTSIASDKPLVIYVNGFLKPHECEALITAAKPKLTDDAASSSTSVAESDFKCITERVEKVVNQPKTTVEPALITRYKEQQDTEHTQESGWTLLVYLSDNNGKTTTDALNFEPKAGDAILFQSSVKVAEQAKGGEKWTAKWRITQK